MIVSNGTIATGSTAYFYVPIIPFEINTEEHVKLIAYTENGNCSRLKDIDNARFDSGNIHLVTAKYSEESDVLKEEAKLRYEKVTSMPTELGTYILVDESSLSVWDGKKTEINYTPIRSISDMIISPVYQRAELNIRPLGEGNYSIKLVNTGVISGIENSISIGNEPVANAISINDGKVSISSNGTYLVFNPATNSFAYYDSSIAEKIGRAHV